MELSLSRTDLICYLKYQTEHFFPDKYSFAGEDITKAVDLALDRLEYCYKFIRLPAYNRDGQTYFSHLHGDQYGQFLYYLMNSLWNLSQNKPICDKLVQLNRMLSGSFFTYNAGLPDIFCWAHPVGTVLGNAKYGNFFVCRHNCTIATQNKLDADGKPLSIGEGLHLGAGAGIYTNNIHIGDRVAIGAGTSVYREKKIESDTLVVNKGGGNTYIKLDKRTYNQRFHAFNVEI